jgi:tRNA threonylcarbamoyladenosine biosynthesis protein TsaE
LQEPDELEMLGIRDFVGHCICIVEWPERFAHILPTPDVDIDITYQGDGRSVAITKAS